MFNIHQPQIGTFALKDAENMKRVYWFVLATIQQSLDQTPEIMKSYMTEGEDSRFLWGFKIPAFDYVNDHADVIYEVAMAIHHGYANPEVRAYELVRYFAGLLGLGVVKGSFMVQLCFGLSGCLDSHNIGRLGLDPSWFKASRFKNAISLTKEEIVKDYLALVDRLGGCEGLWNDWCNHVAGKYPMKYRDGFDVSERHVQAIMET